MKAKLRSLTTATVFGLLFSLPHLSFAQQSYNDRAYDQPYDYRDDGRGSHERQTYERPSAGAMAIDLLVARPALLVATVAGTAVFLVGLPFSAMGGNIQESGDTLVRGPAEAAFRRCLGCVNGVKHDVEYVDYDRTANRVYGSENYGY